MNDEPFYLNHTNALRFWELAKEQEFGWVIPLGKVGTPTLRKYMKMLYEARKGRPDLKQIRMCLPQGGKEIFLVKMTVNLDD